MNTEQIRDAHRISAFDRSTWDEDARKYFGVVDDVMRTRHNQPFHNGRPLHAAYLTYKFFLHAKSCVRLFSGNLTREFQDGPDAGMKFYSDPNIVGSIQEFLSRKGSELKIVLEGNSDVEQGQNITDHPW